MKRYLPDLVPGEHVKAYVAPSERGDITIEHVEDPVVSNRPSLQIVELVNPIVKLVKRITSLPTNSNWN